MNIDLTTFDKRKLHELMASSIVPRPIAFVSTIGRDGVFNLAPEGTPEEVVKTIYGATEKAFAAHKTLIEDAAKKLSVKVDFMSPEEYGHNIEVQNKLFTKGINKLKKMGKQ